MSAPSVQSAPRLARAGPGDVGLLERLAPQASIIVITRERASRLWSRAFRYSSSDSSSEVLKKNVIWRVR